MKNLLLIVALAIAGAMNLNAKTSIHIPTVEEAQTNGWEALWGSYDYGYIMPENYTFVDNDEFKLYLNKAANVATAYSARTISASHCRWALLWKEKATRLYTCSKHSTTV